ncbi:MAG: M1 family metallopeptidase [Candidatus Micrarchaeota archaeon]|nr:M1 family metallopeptidase [Candidatus Micrarchaeota archaeon]
MGSQKREILGDNVIPENYSILLEPSFKTFGYTGKETIRVQIRKATKKIAINCVDLKITKASVGSGRSILPARVSYSKASERITLSLAEKVRGPASLILEFSGKVNKDPKGFYRGKYMYKGKERVMMTTQFEPVDARSAFPCFDEPAMKATFNLSLLIEPGKLAVSNMPIKSEKEIGKRKLVTFATSPKMSTYLLYIGIGDFVIATKKVHRMVMRVVSTPENANKGALAFGFADTFLRYYERYFGVDYPLPKLDMIGVPDYKASSSAMENWGAITFRAVELLADEATVSVNMRYRIAEVIAHELAHQWFGNLVTMKWWDDLWLNESFASFMESKSNTEMYPSFKSDQDHLIMETVLAFASDSLHSTHPIQMRVNSPSEIDQLFDNISYYKGRAVIKMIEDYATPEVFRNGVAYYIKKHEYSNTTNHDLWEALGHAGGTKLRRLPQVARFWVDNPGYPMVKVRWAPGGAVELTQSRYTILPHGGPQKPWPIPIRYITDKGTGFIMMDRETARINAGDAKFIKLNHGENGFYRIHYDHKSLSALGRAIKVGMLSDIESWGVVDDLISFAKSCHIRVEHVLDFIEEYCMDSDYPLNSTISGYLYGIMLWFGDNQKLYGKAKRLATRFNLSILNSVGWVRNPKEGPNTTKLRSAAIRGLGECGEPNTVRRCRAMVNDYIHKGKQIETNIRSAVYMTAAANGDSRLFDEFISLYKKQNGGEEIMRLSIALGNFRDPKLDLRALNFTMSSHVKSQDKDYIAAYVSNSPTGQTVILDWFKKNWKGLLGIYLNDFSGLTRFVEELDTLSTERDRKEVERFFRIKENKGRQVNMGVRRTLEAIEINTRFVEYNS